VNRREFLKCAAGGAALVLLKGCGFKSPTVPSAAPKKAEEMAANLPRWRGFNLVEMADEGRNRSYHEEYFEWMKDWGFDFARLPLNYKTWTKANDWLVPVEPELDRIDKAVDYGRQYGVHINIAFHRAPGYCVNPPAEPLSLWTDSEALDVCRQHWALFARRYKGIPSEQVSFNLINEPATGEESYDRVVRALVAAIRQEDPDRLIIADGLSWAKMPVPSLADLGIAQSTHCYVPKPLAQYRNSDDPQASTWSVPTWPLDLGDKGGVWDSARLQRTCINLWVRLQKLGVGVHVGEFGCSWRTPHPVVLAWMSDLLSLWKQAGWGWALWQFSGNWGIMDSRRRDVAYEDFHGHKLDRKMLELLRAS
jgi:endoglucanase